jgi:hypothetical protein
MELTHEQKQAFYEKGWVKLPGAVPEERVHAARKYINCHLGQEGPGYFQERWSDDPVVADLFNVTPLAGLVESAIGVGKIKPITRAQVALRFPSMDPPSIKNPHLDGMRADHLKSGNIGGFTALVGVLLSDLPDPYAGNFTVWPGSHHLYEKYLREHGPQSLLSGLPKVALPEPEQITGAAGDAVLVHWEVAHGFAGNTSPNIRYATFFRVYHVDHDDQKWEVMADMWREWEGLRDVVAAGR